MSKTLVSQATAAGDRYRALRAVSEAIVSHRDLPTLFPKLAGRLHQVVQFDSLALVPHEAATNTTRLRVLDASEPIPDPLVIVEGDPAGWPTVVSAVTSATA